MMTTILIVILSELVVGVLITTTIAAIRPQRLLDKDKNFRYSLALIVTIGWPLSLLFFLGWALTWTPRYFVRRSVDKVARQE